MLGITRRDKIRNEVVRSFTKVKDIIKRIEHATTQWAGHLARMPSDRWAKKTTEWQPRESKRSRGRPKRRWRDDIEKKAGYAWMQRAQNRIAWREMWRPPASSGVNG